MVPGRRDHRHHRGDTFTHRVTMTEADGVTLMDVSDRTYAAQIRRTPASPDVIVALTVDMTEAADGVVILRLTSAQSAELPARSLAWDLQETVDGEVDTILAGEFNVQADVTRST